MDLRAAQTRAAQGTFVDEVTEVGWFGGEKVLEETRDLKK